MRGVYDELAAAWYPDPSDPGRQRYFDGNA
ncbi:DUF2510 domain-containing protein [Mycolicibacterium sp.]